MHTRMCSPASLLTESRSIVSGFSSGDLVRRRAKRTDGAQRAEFAIGVGDSFVVEETSPSLGLLHTRILAKMFDSSLSLGI